MGKGTTVLGGNRYQGSRWKPVSLNYLGGLGRKGFKLGRGEGEGGSVRSLNWDDPITRYSFVCRRLRSLK